MANRNKARGTAAETAVVNYLQTHGFPLAERRAQHGNKDMGDIGGIPGVVVEVKAAREFRLSQWLVEARVEAINANASVAVVVVKAPGKGYGKVGDWFALMPVSQLCHLLADDEPSEAAS